MKINYAMQAVFHCYKSHWWTVLTLQINNSACTHVGTISSPLDQFWLKFCYQRWFMYILAKRAQASHTKIGMQLQLVWKPFTLF